MWRDLNYTIIINYRQHGHCIASSVAFEMKVKKYIRQVAMVLIELVYNIFRHSGKWGGVYVGGGVVVSHDSTKNILKHGASL